MPSCPRSQIVREGEVGVYHIWSRCVRRAFLCGKDPITGEDHSHRRDWIRGISNVSSFTQALCEHIGLRANREDNCSGHFWEGRFDARDLETESAILVCGIYVDLNQIRAGEALTPEESTHTSAYDRIASRAVRTAGTERGIGTAAEKMPPDGWLCELTLDERAAAYAGPSRSRTPWRASDKGLLPITLDDYLELLDWTGRTIRKANWGSIPEHLGPILDRLGINQGLWTELVTQFDTDFSHVIGTAAQVVDHAKQAGRHWYHGRARCAEAFG